MAEFVFEVSNNTRCFVAKTDLPDGDSACDQPCMSPTLTSGLPSHRLSETIALTIGDRTIMESCFAEIPAVGSDTFTDEDATAHLPRCLLP